MSPDHQAKNIQSWKVIREFIEEFPDNAQCKPWKTLANRFIDEGMKLGLNHYFRAGQAMLHIIFSTLDHHGLRDEPRVTVEFHPEDEVRVAYGNNNLEFNPPTLEYALPFELAFASFRRLLRQLWKATMSEEIPGEILD